jgi:hypothetical protein
MGRPEGSVSSAGARQSGSNAASGWAGRPDRCHHARRAAGSTPLQRHAVAASCLALLLCGFRTASGQTIYRDGFEGLAPTWRIESDRGEPTVLAHAHSDQVFHSGGGSEFLRLAADELETVRLVHDVPAALVFDEFTTSIQVKSNRGGITLAARVRFPHAIDPRSNEPLVLDVVGDRYTPAPRWQLLSCATTDAALRESLIRIRNQLRQWPEGWKLDTREAYVEEMVMLVELQPGATDIYLDDLQAGPIVAPSNTHADVTPERKRSNREAPRALIGDDHFRVDGRPTILRFTPLHGDEAAVLADCGFNAGWIPDYRDSAVLHDLEAAGLYAIAELPPPPDIGEHDDDDRLQVSPLPFSDNPQILFWNIGTRFKADDLQRVSRWTEMVRYSDFERARLLLAEVTGREREFHRRLDGLGVSRHILGTSASPLSDQEFLRQKRDLGFPDKPMFTYVQTEPSRELLARWPADRQPPVIEPEQIWLQCYAALAAGYKGIGYWKRSPLTDQMPGSDERRLAIALVNRHIQLLEPWLATGKVSEVVPGSLTNAAAADSGWGLWRRPDQDKSSDTRIWVSELQSDYGRVLLPVWYEDNAQFQPGSMTAPEVYFQISPPGEDALQAWLVTTTDVTPIPLDADHPAGGPQIRLPEFDQHAAIIIPTDPDMMETLRRQIAASRESTARLWIDLAGAKLSRVESVHAELLDLQVTVPNGTDLLDAARRFQRQAESEFSAGRFNDARRSSQSVLALLRSYQRAQWERAVARLSSGVSSPYTVCFQTLPEHWRLMARIGRGSLQGENLLKSGDFEDPDTIRARWIPDQTDDPAIDARSELYRGRASQGDYALHLMAGLQSPSATVPALAEPALQWISPPVSVYAGQIVYVGGKVRVDRPIAGHVDGLLIYETLEGPMGGQRWRDAASPPKWETFQLLREVRESGELRVVIELRGLGDVMIDDVRVLAIDP